MSDYEKVHFDNWRDLAKAVIDGDELFVKNNVGQYFRLSFDGECFNCKLKQWVENVYIKKQPTLEELIAIKPRLCWVWDSHDNMEREVALIKSVDVDGERKYDCVGFMSWDNAQMLTDDEIKQFLNGE